MKVFVNLLTALRLIATFFLPLIWNFLPAIGILITVAIILLTDFFDGFLARRFNVQTLFGSLADVIADKTFGIVLILIVAAHNPIYYALVILELCIAIINISGSLLGATTKSSFLGKCKMWLLGIATLCGLLVIFESEIAHHFNSFAIFNNFIANKDIILIAICAMTAGAEIMVATDYARHITKELHRSKNKKIKYQFKSKKELKKVLFDTEYIKTHKDIPLSKHLLI